MLNLLKGTINLSNSLHYRRVIIVAYACALGVLWYSACPFFLKLLLFSLLILQPYTGHFTAISYASGKWQLRHSTGQQTSYRQMRIIFNLGLFILIEFREVNQSQQVVIFLDQITQEDYRWLQIMTKIDLLFRAKE